MAYRGTTAGATRDKELRPLFGPPLFGPRAYFCAHRQRKGEKMAAALFAAYDLSPLGCERITESLSLDMGDY